MCGICGFYNHKNTNAIERNDVLSHMMDAIAHRGPDGRDCYYDKDVALGFTRLSFIDLDGGMQPIQNEDKSVTMVCNGEIYNFKELRKELTEKQHVFSTKTDVEVIVHMYEEYGLDFAKKLNGQFAVAIFDSNKSELLLVRDQMGIAPLFYTHKDGRVIFASEIKSIIEYPGVPRKLNLKAVDQLLNFPGTISPTTYFKDIYSLRSGHMILFKKDSDPKDICYFDLEYTADLEDLGEEYYRENLKELLHRAIERRLVADVPIGFYISGGLDSSVVACFIGKYILNSAFSFSAEMDDTSLDESQFQKMVKDSVKTEHYSVMIDERKLWENLSNVIFHAESAVKESYDVAAYLLSELVSQSPAKAVLTGQGSDEIFYGYAGYMVDMFRGMQKDKMTPQELEVNDRLWGDPYFRYERNHPEIRTVHKKLYNKDVLAIWDEFDALKESPIKIPSNKMTTSQRRSYVDCKLRLCDHLLTEHGDRMFFSHSVEGRHPFLDKEVIEFAMRIPDKYKLKGTNEKYIVKSASRGIVPEPILKRKKFPFQAPGMSAMVTKKSNNDIFNTEMIKAQGVFDAGFVEELIGMYSKDDFKLMGAYEIDYLMIITTVTILMNKYNMTL